MLPEWVAKYIGITFVPNGRDISGLDCWGLTRLVLKEQFAIDVPSHVEKYNGIKNREDLERVVEEEKRSWTSISLGNETLGDVIIIRNHGRQSHVGLVLGGHEMLHIEAGINSVTKNYLESDVRHKISGFYRHAGIGGPGEGNRGGDPSQPS